MIDAMKRITGSGALGASVALYFPTGLTPAGGGAFGVIGRLVTEVTQPIFESVLPKLISLCPNNTLQKAEVKDLENILNVTRFIFLAAFTKMACCAIGIPIAFGTALVLQIGQCAISHLMGFNCDLLQKNIPERQKEIIANLQKSLVPAFS